MTCQAAATQPGGPGRDSWQLGPNLLIMALEFICNVFMGVNCNL